jgi:hypothetical protein
LPLIIIVTFAAKAIAINYYCHLCCRSHRHYLLLSPLPSQPSQPSPLIIIVIFAAEAIAINYYCHLCRRSHCH